MSEELELTINGEMVGRIDKQLGHHFDQFSRSQIQQWIEDGHVLVNGKQVKPKYKLLVGDHVQIIPEEPQKIDLAPEDIPLDIVYEDDDYYYTYSGPHAVAGEELDRQWEADSAQLIADMFKHNISAF